MDIDPATLRLFWSIVHSTQSQDLLLLSDAALTAVLLRRVSDRLLLDHRQAGLLGTYIRAKTPLIREIAKAP
jgi:hypothetical protein